MARAGTGREPPGPRRSARRSSDAARRALAKSSPGARRGLRTTSARGVWPRPAHRARDARRPLLFESDGEVLGKTFRALRIANQSQHPEELMRGTQEASGGLPLALGVSGHGQVELGAPHLVSRLDAREGLEGHLEMLLGLRVGPRGIGDAA